jgi:hypothetical protein
MALASPGQLNLDEAPSWGSRSVDCFEKIEQIGEGTYGYHTLLSFFLLCTTVSQALGIIVRTKLCLLRNMDLQLSVLLCVAPPFAVEEASSSFCALLLSIPCMASVSPLRLLSSATTYAHSALQTSLHG